MELNLNHADEFTPEGIGRLLAAGPARPRRVIVCQDGTVSTSETYRCARAFVIELDHWSGPEADDGCSELVHKVYVCLKNNWPVPRDVYL